MIVLFTAFIIWIFREFRSGYHKQFAIENIEIDKAIEVYSELYYNIDLYKNNLLPITKLSESFKYPIIYFPNKITRKIIDLNITDLKFEVNELQEINIEIERQINSLKFNQYKKTTYNDKGKSSYKVRYFILKYDIFGFLLPFMYAYLVCSFITFIILNMDKSVEYSNVLKIMIINILAALIISMEFLDFFRKRKIKNN